MQKDSRIKKPDCTSQIPFSVMPCPICALKVALNVLKLPLRATFLPIRLALSGIFCIFAAKTSRLFNPFCLIREKVVTFRMVKLNMLLSIFLITK